MPESFFTHRPGIKGTSSNTEPKFFSMCTSVPEVRQWLADGLTHVFAQVPELGGVFCITMSENQTNCFSAGRPQSCPRCSKRRGSEVVAEVIQAIRDGVRRQSPQAEIIAWDWGWGYDWIRGGVVSEELIPKLPQDVALLSVSEWAQPVHRGGVSTQVGEYSMSVVGPGPRATRNWAHARQRGLKVMAKVQFNCTWEISAVPYIPVPGLVAEHCKRLRATDVCGLMLSWTVGGYPSPNLEVAKEYYGPAVPEPKEALQHVAERRYGSRAAPKVLAAWDSFARAFQEFPYGVSIYNIPTQHGPANLLRLHPTGRKTAMILFPHDDFKAWAGNYPVEVAYQQFEKMAEQWEKGLETFRQAAVDVPPKKLPVLQKDLGIAETCYVHFRSVANQIRFYQLREQLKQVVGVNPSQIRAAMITIAQNEIQLAKRQFQLARQDSTIAFEASNHYYYRPLDLVEKILNCQQVIQELKSLV